MASGTALLWQSAARLPTGPGATIGSAAQPGAPRRTREGSLMTPQSSYFRNSTASTSSSAQASVLERKRQLEAELAALNAAAGASPSPDSEIRSREGTNSGRFEEVEVPSDVEGYDVGEGDGVGYSRRPGQQQRKSSGWFGGWGAGGKGDYERVKSD